MEHEPTSLSSTEQLREGFAASKTAPEVRLIWVRAKRMYTQQQIGTALLDAHNPARASYAVRSAGPTSAIRLSVTPSDLAYVWGQYNRRLGQDFLGHLIADIPNLLPLVRGLPLLSTAVPHLARRERDMLTGAATTVSIGDAVLRSPDAMAPSIGKIFNTNMRRRRLDLALKAFSGDVRTWLSWPQRRSAANWLFPSAVLKRGPDCVAASLDGRLPGAVTSAILLEGRFRFLSLEYIRDSGKIRRRHIAELRIAYHRSLRSLGFTSPHDPWERTVPQHLRVLPVAWLWQFHPTTPVERFLTRLQRAGITNIGHLIMLDWAFLQSVRRAPPSTYRALLLPEE